MKAPWFLTNENRFWMGASLGVFLLFSAICIFTMIFIVPRFEQIYADAFPGKPLPGITLLILGSRWALVAIDLLWTVAGVGLWWQNHPGSTVWLNLGTLLGILQLGVTISALFMPMVSGTVGLAEPSP